MKRIAAFILTNLMATTMVFAQHTRSYYENDMQTILSGLENIQANSNKSQNECSPRTQNLILNKIDKRIAQAKNSNESLENSIAMELEKFENLKKRQVNMTKRTLKRKWRTHLAYKKMRKSFPSLTKNEFIRNLRNSISPEKTFAETELLKETLFNAGSMENYLLEMKEKIQNCDATFFDGGTMGLIYLILFIGLPVLSIIAALFAVIFGAFAWALGLTIFAVGMLLIFFIWANIGKFQSNEQSRPESEEELNLLV